MVSTYGYVITGGPGSGKTSLIDALAKEGYTIFEEVSRRLIREQQQLPDGVLPWHNLDRFATLALDAMQQQYVQAHIHQQPVFFDRAIPDIAGYLKCAGLSVGETLATALKESIYASPVFICPPWEEIYVNDPERPQTYQEAVHLHSEIQAAYLNAGYTVIEVPQLTVRERVQFIISQISLRVH